MDFLKEKNEIRITGKVKVCAFEPGVMGALLGMGMTLREAMASAKREKVLVFEHETHNLVTTIGKQFIAKRITGAESGGLAYLALGTGSTAPALTDTKLVAETARKALTECYQSGVYFYSSVFLLGSECTFYIKEGGLFGGALATATADSGTLLSRFLLDEDNSVNGYDLTIQHTGEIK